MRKAKYGFMLLIILVDQAVKAGVRGSFAPGESKDLMGSFFSLTYVKNTGAAFSMFRDMNWLLMAVPVLAIVFGIWYMEKHRDRHRTLYLSLILTIGGGMSNLIDRFVFGFVTDMFDFHFWPVFNVADIAICTGCGILVIYILKYYSKDEENDL